MACTNCGGGRVEPTIERHMQPVLETDLGIREYIASVGWVFESKSCNCNNAKEVYSHPVLTNQTGYKIMVSVDNSNLQVITTNDRYVKASFGTLNWKEGYSKFFN